MSSTVLSAENYAKGFLIDEELMGGVSEIAEGGFLAYVLRHTTGEYLGQQSFARLDEALGAINAVQRPWQYESASGCGGGNCQAGPCSQGGSCGKSEKKLGEEKSALLSQK